MADFKGNRYMTRGIASDIDLPLQIILWNMIDENIKKGQEMDYLQVFKLNPVNSCGITYQEIIHSQEVPPYEKRIIVKTDNPVSEKIFVIDSEDYVTMLLASEY